MGEIFRELQEESKEHETRTAFERWMAERGTPLPLEQTQAYEAFKAGMEHQSCMTAVRMFQTEGAALRNAAEELIRDARRWREVDALMSNSGAEMSINSGGWALLKHAMEAK